MRPMDNREETAPCIYHDKCTELNSCIRAVIARELIVARKMKTLWTTGRPDLRRGCFNYIDKALDPQETTKGERT